MYNHNPHKLDWAEKISNSLVDFRGNTSNLSGNHKKLLMNISDDNLYSTSSNGDVIVKDSEATHKIFEQINANEHFFTYLAGKSGIDTAKQILIPHKDDFLLFSEKFDKNAELYHLSEFLNLRNYTEVSLGDFTDKVESLGLSDDLKMDMATQVYFNLLIGNLDTHANNFALIRNRDGSYKMSPMYDVAHTDGLLRIHGDMDTKNIMKINGKTKEITVKDIFSDLGLSSSGEVVLLKRLKKITSMFSLSLREMNKSYIDKNLQTMMREIIKENLKVFSLELKKMSKPNKKPQIWREFDEVFPKMKESTDSQKVDFSLKTILSLDKHLGQIERDILILGDDNLPALQEENNLLQKEHSVLEKKLEVAESFRENPSQIDDLDTNSSIKP